MRRIGDLGGWLVAVPILALALVFVVYPLGNAILLAFVRKGAEVTFANLTLLNFERFFISRSWQQAFFNSIISSGGATALAAVLAVPMAFIVARVAIPLRSLVLGLSVIPLIAPPFIGAYAWIILLGNNGIITQLVATYMGLKLPTIYGAFGVTVALALSYIPYLFLIVQGALAASDPTIEEAATITGASRLRIIRTVTLPMAAPAIAAGMLIVFIKAMGDFGVPSILGGEFQVLPTLLYYQIHGFFNLNAGSAIALVNVLLTVAALALLKYVSRRDITTVTGTSRAAERATGLLARVSGNAYLWFVLLLALLPQAMVALYSFSLRWGDTLLPSAYGFDTYRDVAAEALVTMSNSVIVAGAATLVCVVFGTLAAYSMLRGRAAARWAIDLTVMVPFVLPGIVVGVAYLATFNDGPLVLTGTATILVMAYFTRRVAFIFRAAAIAIGQIDPRIEEASTVCGASWLVTMRRVTLPLIAPGLLAGAVLVFATLIGEISATVLLYSANWKPISIAIYERVLGNELARASALGTLCNLATLALVLVASRLAGRNMSDMFR